MSVIIGVDPGINGAVARLCDGLSEEGIQLIAMPTREVSVDRYEVVVRELTAMFDGADLIVIEDVGTNPKFGVQRAFTFGKVYGQALAAIEFSQVPSIRVKPMIWKKAMLAGTDQSKEAAVQKINLLYPQLRLEASQHDYAEALLMAMYGRIQHR